MNFCSLQISRDIRLLREAKPGGFPLFSGKVQIVSRTLSGLFLVGAVNRPRKRTNRDNPRRVPRQIRKIPEKSGKSQKGQKRTKKRRTSPDRETPPFETSLFSGPWGFRASLEATFAPNVDPQACKMHFNTCSTDSHFQLKDWRTGPWRATSHSKGEQETFCYDDSPQCTLESLQALQRMKYRVKSRLKTQMYKTFHFRFGFSWSYLCLVLGGMLAEPFIWRVFTRDHYEIAKDQAGSHHQDHFQERSSGKTDIDARTAFLMSASTVVSVWIAAWNRTLQRDLQRGGATCCSRTLAERVFSECANKQSMMLDICLHQVSCNMDGFSPTLILLQKSSSRASAARGFKQISTNFCPILNGRFVLFTGAAPPVANCSFMY